MLHQHALPPSLLFQVVRAIISVQHIIFVPVLLLVGPYGVRVDSFFGENRFPEVLGLLLHWVLMGNLIMLFPTVSEGILFHYLSSAFAGVLMIQLLVSHYAHPFQDKDESKKPGTWMLRQIESVTDIDCPWWMDWFHGGLNLHSPHHVFPRLTRSSFRRARKLMVEACKRHNVEIRNVGWVDAVRGVIKRLKEMEELVDFDIRK